MEYGFRLKNVKNIFKKKQSFLLDEVYSKFYDE